MINQDKIAEILMEVL